MQAHAVVPKVIVGSGWWCDGRTTESDSLGDPATRTPGFFDTWYTQVRRCLTPCRVVVTDSRSPVKPADRCRPDVVWIELDRNYGHANDLRLTASRAKYCGFTRSVLTGAMYAVCCDADYYVYVEQDCLLKGEGFLTHAVGDSECDILIGPPTQNGRGLGGRPAASMLQQSLMIVRKSGLNRFIGGLLESPWTDGEMSPEEIMRQAYDPLDTIRVPFGRSRPIDYSRTHCYAHHLEAEELRLFVASCGSETV